MGAKSAGVIAFNALFAFLALLGFAWMVGTLAAHAAAHLLSLDTTSPTSMLTVAASVALFAATTYYVLYPEGEKAHAA